MAMRPFSSGPFEPGVEPGGPWGRDLFTFVTSAAGHMMRTLQRPRKNRPSKRQVNHRRFLHNMIQRKFAEIEAANQQLSALFPTENALSSSSPLRHTGTPEQQSDSLPKQAADLTLCSNETGVSQSKHADYGHILNLSPKGHPDQSDAITSSARRKSLGKRAKSHTLNKRVGIDQQSDHRTPASSERTIGSHQRGELAQTGPVTAAAVESEEDSLCSWIESIREKYDPRLIGPGSGSNVITPPLGENLRSSSQDMDPSTSVPPSLPPSPGLSPLSLDSCDFEIQMMADLETGSQYRYGYYGNGPAESQGNEVLDLLGSEVEEGGGFGGFMEAQAPLEDIWEGQVDAEGLSGKALMDDITFLDQSGGFVDLCGLGPGCEGSADPRSATSSFVSDAQDGARRTPASEAEPTERAFARPKPTTPGVEDVVTPNRLTASVRYRWDVPEPDALRSACCRQDGAFVGVARSFPAPAQSPHQILTPPLEDEWLFADIMEDEDLSV